MLSGLKSIIPGAEGWPSFARNLNRQFESRMVMVRVVEGAKSILLQGMAGSVIPVVCAHGEGRVEAPAADLRRLHAAGQVGYQYVDGAHAVTEAFPHNPNGSPDGIACVSSADGRVTIMMPHPERVIRSASMQLGLLDGTASEFTGWLRMFQNARAWVG